MLGVDLCSHAAALYDRQARSQTHRIQDLAITPVTEDEVATHEMLRTDAARDTSIRSAAWKKPATAPLPEGQIPLISCAIHESRPHHQHQHRQAFGIALPITLRTRQRGDRMNWSA